MVQLQTTTRRQRPSFTLVELLVVVTILGILAGIGFTTIPNQRARTRNAQRVASLKILQTAMERYYQKNGKYPYPSLPNCLSAVGTYSCMLDGKDHNGSGVVNPGCQVTYDNSWTGLQAMLAPYIQQIPNDPLNVALPTSNTNEKYHWDVIVSSPDDNHQHYLIVAGLEAAGSDNAFNTPGAIFGYVRRQANVYPYGGGPWLGSITYHSNSTTSSSQGGGNTTCSQTGDRNGKNGYTINCGAINFSSGDAGAYPNGTYYNLCLGNIFKPAVVTVWKPGKSMNWPNDDYCDHRGWFEKKADNGGGCYNYNTP